MKNMKKALSLFLALSMLLTVCAVNVLADDTVTLTVPNGNFAETCTTNSTSMPGGWVGKVYSGTVLASNSFDYFINSTCENSKATGAPSTDGSYSLSLKDNGTGGALYVESPKISLESALTEEKEFTTAFDVKMSRTGANTAKVSLFFYNAEGKVYDGGRWIDEIQSPSVDTDLQLKDAVGNGSFVAYTPSAASTWGSTSFKAIAPIGTSSVSVALIASTSQAIRFWYDNVAISYKSLPAVTGPQPVTNLAAAAGDGQVTLSWSLPSITTDYAGVSIAVKNGSTLVDTVDVMSTTATSKVITGLTNGVEYTFEVTSVNADKTMFSAAVSATATPEGKAVSSGGVFTIPNADFEKTVTANSADISKYGWEVAVYPSDKTLVTGQNCYEISNLHKSSSEGFPEMAPNTPGSQTVNNTLRIKQTSGSTYGSFLMQNKLPLAETFTSMQKVTFQFDYAYRLMPPIYVTMLFYNEDGKVWNGATESWETLEVTRHSDWQRKDAVGRESYAIITPGGEGVAVQKVWGTYSFSSIAPVGTAAVSIGFTSIASQAGITYIDNLKGTWEAAPEFVWATVSSGENGSISPSGKLGVVKGETETFQIRTADTSYILNQVKYNGVPVEVTGPETATDKDGNPVYYYYNYTTPAMTADATIDVSFTLAEEQEKIMSAPATFTGTESTAPYGLAFATVSLGTTLGEYGVLFSETELDSESFIIGAEGVFDGKAMTAANAKGQYGIKLTGSLLSGKTYYTRAYAKYGENYVYSDRIITVIIP